MIRNVRYRVAAAGLGICMAAATVVGSSSGAAVASPSSAGHGESCRDRGAPPTQVEVPVGGVTRTALVHVPASVRASRRAPLVLSFHGAGSTAEFQASYDGVDAQADAAGFIAVHPQGLTINLLGATVLGWDIFSANSSEPAFVRALLDRLDATLCVDDSRVYAIGISNGGGMVELLACTLSDRIAAVATVAALPALPCPGSRPVPTIAFHGRQDLLIPYDGIAGLAIPGAEADLAGIAARNDCSTTQPAPRSITAQVARLRWRDCEAATVLYRLDGQGHSWPGHSFGLTEAQWVQLLTLSGPLPGLTIAQQAGTLALTNNEIDATALSWSFFRNEHLAERDDT